MLHVLPFVEPNYSRARIFPLKRLVLELLALVPISHSLCFQSYFALLTPALLSLVVRQLIPCFSPLSSTCPFFLSHFWYSSHRSRRRMVATEIIERWPLHLDNKSCTHAQACCRSDRPVCFSSSPKLGSTESLG